MNIGRTVPLKLDQSGQLAAVLTPAESGSPWPDEFTSYRWGGADVKKPLVKVQPNGVVEVTAPLRSLHALRRRESWLLLPQRNWLPGAPRPDIDHLRISGGGRETRHRPAASAARGLSEHADPRAGGLHWVSGADDGVVAGVSRVPMGLSARAGMGMAPAVSFAASPLADLTARPGNCRAVEDCQSTACGARHQSFSGCADRLDLPRHVRPARDDGC